MSEKWVTTVFLGIGGIAEDMEFSPEKLFGCSMVLDDAGWYWNANLIFGDQESYYLLLFMN